MAHVGHCVDLVLDLVSIELDIMLSRTYEYFRNDGVVFRSVLRRYDEMACYDVDAMNVAERLLVPLLHDLTCRRDTKTACVGSAYEPMACGMFIDTTTQVTA